MEVEKKLDMSLDDIISGGDRKGGSGGGGGSSGGGGGGRRLGRGIGRGRGRSRNAASAPPRRYNQSVQLLKARDAPGRALMDRGRRGGSGQGRGGRGVRVTLNRRAEAMMEGPQRRAEGTTVTIEGLEYSVMQDDLYELFQSIGQVVKVWIDYDSTDRSAGSGGVVFASTADAEQAVKRYNGKLLDGKQLSLELDPYAQPNTSSSGGFGGMMPTRGRGRGRGRALLQPARGRGGPSGW
ncbi:unnamed protein product [Vitrella brassicaformis CCMP3155]|uniref:RRM domain-containing protein n=1 Tax=Vitrella brassicaformis (strain CCMP3155) TaxID=1169540 RepID=A0A0G4E9Q4_VITBC|nr:unnamed protein product [Vitrella brassicaformis CCMP3155]|eukprot:CEL92651.1 unnamed protein product [Vitrella brassicaformis CCMP3155]